MGSSNLNVILTFSYKMLHIIFILYALMSGGGRDGGNMAGKPVTTVQDGV